MKLRLFCGAARRGANETSEGTRQGMSENQVLIEPQRDERAYVAVQSQFLRPWVSGSFSVFIKKGGHFVLYAAKGGAYTRDHRSRLRRLGVETVYISRDEIGGYRKYVRDNLDDILTDETIVVEKRADAWFDASVSLARDVLDSKLPKPLSKKRYDQIELLIRQSLRFFKTPDALKNLVRLVSKGYRDFQHGVAVMVLTAFVLQETGTLRDDALVACGVGALLHDLGKVGVPQDILDKKPEARSAEEEERYRSHPSLGAGLCANLPLPVETFHCLLFHHEQEDGRGWPARLAGEALPAYVKALSVCDAYDRLTRARPYRPAYTPFEALQRIETRKEAYDIDMIKRLIKVLSNADVITTSGTGK